MSDEPCTEGEEFPPARWRVASAEGGAAVHVYADADPVASFLGPTLEAARHARQCVAAVNGMGAATRAHRHLSGARAALQAQSRRYEGLANVFRATAGGNAEALTGVYSDAAQVLARLAAGLDDDLGAVGAEPVPAPG